MTKKQIIGPSLEVAHLLRQIVEQLRSPHSSEWLDLKQAEAEFPLSKRTLQYWISDRRLPAFRPQNKKILVRRSDLNKVIEQGRIGADLDDIVDETVKEVLRRD